MDDLTQRDSLELEVANFGPIVEAKLDLRPLTVFVGPSNTGKSYLAILIYALHRFYRTSADNWIFSDAMLQRLPQKTLYAIDEWAQQTFVGKSVEGSLVLPALFTDEIGPTLDAQGDQLNDEISRCFGIGETSALVRKRSRGARIVFRKQVANSSAPFEHELVIGTPEAALKTTLPAETPLRIDAKASAKIRDLYHQADLLSKERHSSIVQILSNTALSHLVGPLRLPAFYLPADRTGVMHAHRVIASAMIGNAAMAGLRPISTPMLSGVLADFLQQLIEIVPSSSSQRDLGTQIEKAILGGSVRVNLSQPIGYPHFTYQPKGWKNALSLMNASSMVSELAPVVLYLRHVVQPGNLLLIEEPEAHLHPTMQVEFTRQIAALVHAGIRVIVTTHSEWVLETLANLVRLSELPKARRKGIEGADWGLRPDQVGAWLFESKSRPKGSVVKEVKLDEEAGLYPTDFDAVSEALYNESVRIFNHIEDSKAE